MSDIDILAALSNVVDVLDDLGVRYHVGGSVASSAHGIARATLDVDIVADLKRDHARAFAEGLESDYYVDEHIVAEAIGRCGSFNVIHLATMIKIDVFVLKTREYDKRAFERMIPDTLEEGENARLFFLASPEDTILNKLEWYRTGGEVADRQWRDVLGVLKVQAKDLDMDYMRHWAHEIDVDDLLDRAVKEADL